VLLLHRWQQVQQLVLGRQQGLAGRLAASSSSGKKRKQLKVPHTLIKT
jgi:hypothetical protein